MLFMFLLGIGTVRLCHCHGGDGPEPASCTETERHALLTLKTGISDDHGWLSSWKGEDCCTWRGVGCNATTGHVVKLDLRYPYPYDVEYSYYPDPRRPNRSEVSPSLLDLMHLRYLDLSMNYFDGAPIPEFIGSLPNLAYLNLSDAGFGGTIPRQLGNLSSLRYLDLASDNQYYTLNVDGLGWLSKLASLHYLDMSFVDLSSASDWIHIVNMLPSLSVLRLSHAVLPEIPATLQHINFTSLSVLDLSGNELALAVPGWLFKLSRLVRLSLGSNGLSGEIPISIGNLSNLQVLDLSSNSFSGVIPETVWSLRSLRNLDLSRNNISGKIPEAVGNLSSLRSLVLYSNKISGKIPETVGNLRNLQSLELSSNSISGEIPELEYIDLSSNDLSGEIPKGLTNLHGLHFLDLSGNHLGGKIPDNIGAMGQLESLDLSMNNLSGSIPSSMCALNFLGFLNLSDNNLSGRVPADNQLHTFTDPSIYSNNIGLCGPPLLEKCPGYGSSQGTVEKKGDEDESIWLYVGFASGFVVGFWGLVGTIMIKRSRRIAYIQFINKTTSFMFS